MPSITLVQLRVGRAKNWGTAGSEEPLLRPWRSAIFKQPATGLLHLGKLGLEGDEVADRKHHGGLDQAVLAYASEHYPLWQKEGVDAEFGAFGENLLLAGLTDQTACIGDEYQMGEGLIQISHPRQPCNTLARRFRRHDIVGKVWDWAFGGWYCRVLHEGAVEAGTPLILHARPNPEWTVARVLHAYHHAAKHPDEAMQAAEAKGLTESWVQKLREKAGA